ncbi:hypothetical protein NLX67_04835 [Domibacillus sp. A3M-37]|nr:hypothetical protein [Domibacillus sp. A3M-37]MCP3761709.1 hypothetical protein [Domibacillus sp. A3M-37]
MFDEINAALRDEVDPQTEVYVSSEFRKGDYADFQPIQTAEDIMTCI